MRKPAPRAAAEPSKATALTRFDDENRPIAEMQATAGDVVALWNDSLESFTNSATGDVIPTKLYRYDSDDRLAGGRTSGRAGSKQR